MEGRLLDQSAWRRASEDTQRALGTFRARVGQGIVAAVAAVLAAWLAPTEGDYRTRAVIGAVAGLVGLCAYISAAFLANLVAAPVRQRNEARAAIRRLEQRRKLADVLRVEPAPVEMHPAGGGRLTLGFLCSNVSDSDVADCRVRVESLEWWGETEERWYPEKPFSQGLLHWSADDGGGESMRIGARSQRRCDFVFSDKPGEWSARMAFANPALGESVRLSSQLHRARCHFEAPDHLPMDVEVTFERGSKHPEVVYMGMDDRLLAFREVRVLGPSVATPLPP